ncbi:gamma-aminobutyric acid type B receptor subunit 2-like [Acropora muricata]|uniref:gamma-aminobutyric acid type B receptor subunit 2-like n=1 Tax=Acropora muricata TaxID=159855 RepID=UPI0034E45479
MKGKGCFNFVLILICYRSCQSKETLYIGGLFGLDTARGGWSSAGIIPAVQMAIDDINNSSKCLKDYHLELLIKDSQCSVGEAVRRSLEYISYGKPKIMFLGPGCSKASIPVAEAIHYWNIVQIGFSGSSPLLSSKSLYPLYFRTNPSETFANLGRIAILRRFNWKRVAILQQNNDVFTGISNSLVELLEAANFSVIAYESFKDHPGFAIENLKSKDARIIFAFFYPDQHYVTFCEAYKQGMYGPKYVWVLFSGRNQANWWKQQSHLGDCTPEQVRKGLSNNIGTGELKLSPLPGPTICGRTPQELYNSYQLRLKESGYSENTFASYGYDAAWACALTLNASIEVLRQQNLTLSDFTYSQANMSKIFVEIMKGISFRGMTGQVKFDSNYDRISKLEVRQIQGDTERRVGLYDMETGSYEDNGDGDYLWDGGKVPVDGLYIARKSDDVHPILFWFAFTTSTLGVIMAVVFLIFNIYHQNVRYIKMSSPNLNNLIILGCILVYVSGVLFGLDKGVYCTGCQVEIWFLAIGFSLGFGAMFSKTWRVHVIFLKCNNNKRVIIRDHQLFGMVAVLLLIDFIILITWQLVDPLTTRDYNLTLEISPDYDIAIQRFTTTCTSKHISIWQAIMFGYKGLLLLFGAYLAWETRKVHIPALNDSKMIGLSVYNVIIPCALVIPIVGLVHDRPTTQFALTSFLTIFCTTFTLCFVFVPKMLFLRKGDGNCIPTVSGSIGVLVTPTNLNSPRKPEESVKNAGEGTES